VGLLRGDWARKRGREEHRERVAPQKGQLAEQVEEGGGSLDRVYALLHSSLTLLFGNIIELKNGEPAIKGSPAYWQA
jgi:hypothetical protein